MTTWRLTLFKDDDATPLAVCSTDPAHVRPYLHVPESFAESEVDLAEGTSVIGQVNVRVLDKRTSTDPDDPDARKTGWLTALLPTSKGESALNGRRALLEQNDGSGPDAWFTVMDGVVGGVALEDNYVTYALEIRDVRDRERKVRVFDRADTATIFPRGVIGGYGRQGYGWLIAPTRPVRGVYKRNNPNQGVVDLLPYWKRRPGDGRRVGKVYSNFVVTKTMKEALKPETLLVQELRAGVFRFKRYQLSYARARILWRPWVSSGAKPAWKEIVEPVRYDSKERGLIRTARARVEDDDDGNVVDAAKSVLIGSSDPALLPLNNQQIELIVAYNGPPTETYPLHLDGMTAGELLRDLYDGKYSPAEDMADPRLRVRYDPAAVLALNTPVRARITEPVDDLRGWIEENVFKPLGAAPALDAQGRVSPIRYALPDATVPLVQLDDGNTAPDAGWEHSAGDAVNRVIVTYQRDYVVTEDEDPDGESVAGDGITSVEVTIERRHAESIAMLGEKEMQVDTLLFRAVGGVDGEPLTGEVADEIGHHLAMERATQALDRFLFGAQRISARCRRSATIGLRVGDWVLVALSWLPEYGTGRRGSNRLAQVVAVKDLNPAWRELSLVDAGPANQPLTSSALGALTVSAEGVVGVPVTLIPAGGEAAVSYALSPTLPGNTSGDWRFLERTAVTATLETPPLPAGSTVWVRTRGEAPGRRPSAWTNPVSISLPQTPRVREVKVEIDPATRNPVVSWLPNEFAAGVRVRYQEHDAATEPAPTLYRDASAAAGSLVIPVQVTPGRWITVDVEPRTGWSGTAATGTIGEAVRASAHLLAAAAHRVRTAVEVSEDGGVGTLTLTVTDPDALVAQVRFMVTDGSGARTGPHAADEPPAGGVYVKRVQLHAEHNSLIEPVVTLIDGSTLRPGSETFDRDRAAEIVGRPQVSYDRDQAIVAVTADGDTASLHAEEKVGTVWVAPSELPQKQFATGQRGTFTVKASTAGQRVFRVFGKNADGVAGAPEEVRVDRYEVSSPVTGVLWATVSAAGDTADLRVRVDGPAAAFPVDVEIYRDDPGQASARLNLNGAGLFQHRFAAPGTIGPESYLALNDVPLPTSSATHWWARLTDALGSPPSWANTAADRDTLPGGSVTPDDFRVDPALVCTYDDDVTEIAVFVPGGKTRTFPNLAGGGVAKYTVGTALDDGTAEPQFKPEEGAGRGTYRVEFRGPGGSTTKFSGPLHGPSANAPTCEPLLAVDPTRRDRVDVSLRVYSPVGEQVSVEMKDTDAPGAAVWKWVAVTQSQTLAYAASGTVVPSGAEFFSPGQPNALRFNDLELLRDQVRKIYVRVLGKDSKLPSPWMPVVLPSREQPWLESIDLSWDEITDELVLRAVGGAHCASARFQISTESSFDLAVPTLHLALADGADVEGRFPLPGGARGTRIHGRVTPYNGPVHAPGLEGQSHRDAVEVPAVSPSVYAKVALDPVFRDEVDLRLVGASPVDEEITFQFRYGPDEEIWTLSGLGDAPTPRFVPSGSEVGENDWFDWGQLSARVLNSLPLLRDQIRQVYARVVSRSGIESEWISIALQVREQPRLENMALVWDGGSGTLSLTAHAGAFCRSARFQLADNPEFHAPETTVLDLVDGNPAFASATFSLFLPAADRGKTWYGAVIPYNQPGGGGIRGEAPVEQVFVNPTIGTNPPTAQIAVRSSNLRSVQLTLTGELAEGGRGPLEYRYTQDEYGEDPSWGSWLPLTGPVRKTAIRHRTIDYMAYLEVRDADGNVGRDTYAIYPFFLGLGPGGRVDPDQRMENDQYPEDQRGSQLRVNYGVSAAYRATSEVEDREGMSGTPGARRNTRPTYDAAGLNPLVDTAASRILNTRLDETVRDHGSRPVNQMFAKESPSAPDSLDGITEGTAFKRTTPQEKLGGSRAHTGLADNGYVRAGIENGAYVNSSTAGSLYRTNADTINAVSDTPQYARTNAAYLDTGRVASVYRNTVAVGAGSLFRNQENSLDDVSAASTVWRKPAAGYLSTEGYIHSVYRNSLAVGAGNLFRSQENTLDDVSAASTLWRKSAAGYLDTSGRIHSLYRNTLAVGAESLFRNQENTLDDVSAASTTWRKPAAGYVSTEGYVHSVYRNSLAVGAGLLFRSQENTLDDVSAASTVWRKPAAAYLTPEGYVQSVYRNSLAVGAGLLFRSQENTLDDVSAASTVWRKSAAGYLDTSGRIHSLYRNTLAVGAESLFRNSENTLDDVSAASTTWRKAGSGYLDTSGRIHSVYRNSLAVGTGLLFRSGENTLDDVSAASTVWRKPAAGYISTEGYVHSVYRNSLAVGAGLLFRSGENTLDDVSAASTTWRKPSYDYLTAEGYIHSVFRNGTGLSAGGLFRSGENTLDDVSAASTTWRKPSYHYLTAEGYVHSVFRNGMGLSAGGLFRSQENTLDDVSAASTVWRKASAGYLDTDGRVHTVRRGGLDIGSGDLFRISENSTSDLRVINSNHGFSTEAQRSGGEKANIALDDSARVRDHTRVYPVMAANRTYAIEGGGSPITSSNSGGYVTINVAPHSIRFAWGTVSLPSGSTAGYWGVGERVYVFATIPNYVSNGQYSGTLNLDELVNDPNKYYVGFTTVPASGSTGGGGGGGCVLEDSFLLDDLVAGDARPGDEIDVWIGGEDQVVRAPIQGRSGPIETLCVRLTSPRGASLVVGWSTPLTLRDGTAVRADAAEGAEILTDVGGVLEWEPLHVEQVGPGRVVHFSLGGAVFAAGERPNARIYTHNVLLRKQEVM